MDRVDLASARHGPAAARARRHGHGFSATSIPSALALPPSPAACTLWASPDLTEFALVTAGTLDVKLPLPDDPALAGLVLRQQLVLLEVNAQLQFAQNTVSNALTATVGMF